MVLLIIIIQVRLKQQSFDCLSAKHSLAFFDVFIFFSASAALKHLHKRRRVSSTHSSSQRTHYFLMTSLVTHLLLRRRCCYEEEERPSLIIIHNWQISRLGLMFEQDIHVRTISSFGPSCSSGFRTFSSSVYYYRCSVVCFIIYSWNSFRSPHAFELEI